MPNTDLPAKRKIKNEAYLKRALSSHFLQFFIVACVFFVAGLIWSRLQLNPDTRVAKYMERPELKLLIPSQIAFQDVIESFQVENKIRLSVTTFDSPSELEALIKADPTFDVIGLYCHQIEMLSQTGRIEKLNKELLPNFKNIAPDFQRNIYDPDAEYSAAISWGINGLIYNSETVSEKPDSWGDLFEGQLEKRSAIIPSHYEAIANLVRRGLFEWEWLKQDREEFLTKQFKSLADYFKEPKKAEIELLEEKLWAAQTSNGRAAYLINQDSKFQFSVPKEGATFWVHSLAVSSLSQKKDLAHKFIDYLLQEDVALETVEFLKEASANQTVENAAIDERLKPSFLRSVSLNKLEYPKDLSHQESLLKKLKINP